MALPQINNWQEAFGLLGLSTPVIAVLAWVFPKAANAFKAWLALKSGNSDLAAQLQGGTKDVVILLREQLAAAEEKMAALEKDMSTMRQTMNQLLDERDATLRAKATAESDLFLQGLRVNRLENQIASLGQTPVQ